MLYIYANVINHALMLSNVSAGYSAVSLPTGSIATDAVEFSFSGADWDACSTKKAVFWQDPGAPYEVTITNNIAAIPSEVLTDPGIVYLGVYGDNGSTRITSNVRGFTAEQGALTAETAPAPTPSLFEQAVDEAVDDALETIIDATLTVSGKAADAKAAGDEITNLSNGIITVNTRVTNVAAAANSADARQEKFTADATGNSIIRADHTGGYIDISTTPVDIENKVSESNSSYIVESAAEGDVFTIASNRGGTKTGFLSFLDSSNNLIGTAHYTTNENTYRTYTAPTGTAKIVVNFNSTLTQYAYRGELLVDTVTNAAARCALTGYTAPTSGSRPSQVAATDTINEAMSKLQGQINEGGGGGGGTVNAVLYTAQTLSTSEKAQARTNIGAGTYSKPLDGIPGTDLASGVIPSVPSASSSTPQALGTAAAGSSTDYSRADHVHAMPTARNVGAIPEPDSPAVGSAPVWDGLLWSAKVLDTAEVTVSTAGAVTQALDPGKMYHFSGALTSLTLTFNTPATGQLAQYHFDFTEGSTAFDPTLPNGVVLPDSHTWEADTRYEVDILNGYAVVVGWAVS